MLLVAWVIFHVLTCIALVLVVLMQSAKGEGLAGGTAFGGAMSSAVFGGRGTASFLSKATTVLAVLFMLNCGALAFMSRGAQRVAVSSDGTAVPQSAVTRQAQEEQQAAMERQAAAQQAIADSAAADSLVRILPGGTDTTGVTVTPNNVDPAGE